MGWVVAVVLVALGGGYWWWSNGKQADPGPEVRIVDTEPRPGRAERDRDALREQIERDIRAAEPEQPEEPPEEDGFEVVDKDPVLIPIPPKDRGKGASSPGDPNASLPPSGSGSADADVADGEAAFRRREYRAAAEAFRRAVDKEPRNARYNGRLGAALARAGNSEEAMAPLTTAASGGYTPALVYLGDLAQQQGDTAGAVGYYQSYLATDPPDAPAIQVKLKKLLDG